MKRLICSLLAFVLLFALATCQAEPSEPLKIGVVLARADEFNLSMEKAWRAIDEANENVEVSILISQDNQSQQYADCEALLARGCQTLVVKCVDYTAAADMVKMIKAAGAYVIIDESMPEECTPEDYDLHIKSENIQHGENVGRCLKDYMEKHPDKQLYMGYIQGKEMPNPKMRHDGIYNIVTQEEVVELAYEIAEWKAERAASITEGWLTAFPEMNVIACANDTMACAVVETLIAAGIDTSEDFIVTGVDGDTNGLQYIKEGKLYATSKQDTSISANVAFENAVKLINGEALEYDDPTLKTIDPKMITLVTAENVADYLG